MKTISAVLALSLLFLPSQTALAFTPEVAASPFHYAVLKNDGTVWQWGHNPPCPTPPCSYPGIESESPVEVSGLTGVSAIARGGEQTLALKCNGTVWAWGKNNFYQLGDGTASDRTIPGPVLDLKDVKAISAGSSHGVALKYDGSVWAWGYNGWGSIGDGTTTNRSTPVSVPNLSGITSIAAYGSHSMALKDDGTVWVWGGSHGVTTPFKVENLSDVTAIAPGGAHNLVLKTDGTVWAWGINSYGNGYGQLGDGTSDNNRPTPGRVSNLTGIKAIAAGGDHSMALKDDGTVWTWGYNYVGQLGDGTTTNRSRPVQALGLSGMVEIAAGGDHSIGLKADGTVWVWGMKRVLDFGHFEIFSPPQTFGPNFNLYSYRYSLKDLIALLQFSAGRPPADGSPLCLVKDANADGRIGLEEAVFLLQSVAGMRDPADPASGNGFILRNVRP